MIGVSVSRRNESAAHIFRERLFAGGNRFVCFDSETLNGSRVFLFVYGDSAVCLMIAVLLVQKIIGTRKMNVDDDDDDIRNVLR